MKKIVNFLKDKLLNIKYVFPILGLIVFATLVSYTTTIPVSNSITGKVIVLDAGHGGKDGGAIAKDGTVEKDLNLKIALKVKELLEKKNIKVILTRDSDKDLCDGEKETIKSRKVQDINKRIDIINNSNANLLVSIHMNSFPQEKYSGWQTFYKKNCVYSSEVAKLVQENIGKTTQIDNNRVAMEINGVKIIEKSTIPAILIECGFLSNEEEAKMLNTEEYQKQIAEGIVNGIVQWYNN